MDEGVETGEILWFVGIPFLLDFCVSLRSIFTQKVESENLDWYSKMDFKIQYASDLHLEMHDKQNEGYFVPSMFLKPTAPYLALCGDIGIPELVAYDALLSWCSKSWKVIFVVAGNHEYYNYRCESRSDMVAKNDLLRSLCNKYSNVKFLDCDSYYFSEHNVRVLGCTLWTDTSIGDQYIMTKYMNDYRNINAVGDLSLSPPIVSELHTTQRKWLEKEINKAEQKGEDVLVLTHHLPSFRLIHEKYEGNPLNMCFASDCEDLLRSPVKGWICGHSHTGMRLEIHGVECRMNPYGYPGERVETRSREAVLSLGAKEVLLDI